MMLGAAVAYFTIDLSIGPEKAAPFPALLWFSAVPIFDTLILIVLRGANGNNPLCGDRRHLHHILLKAGISPQAAAGILIAVCVLLGFVGVVGWCLGIPNYLMALGLLLPFTLHVYVVLHGWKLVAQFCATRSASSAVARHALPGLGD
jgi:UDP-GlcNAc:undecaprenyl-phosphate GlcNAc-1-phosphate transferase